MKKIPNFNDTEIWGVETTLSERYGKKVAVELADAEIRLDPSERVLTPCPVICWSELGANFVVFKLGERAYRPQFYYRGYQQFGTGVNKYDDIAECVTALLQVQADHHAKEENSD